MAAHSERREESLRSGLLGSILFHLALLAVVVGAGYLHGRAKEQMGDVNTIGGGSISVNVAPIPLPRTQPRQNPVANDTKSQLPTPPKPEVKRQEREDPDAVALKGKERKKPAPRETVENRIKPRPPEPEQRYSNSGQQVSSPLYGGKPGSGPVGVNPANPFGSRFGAYAALLQQRVTQQWVVQAANLTSRQPNPAVVSVEILKNGSTRNISIARSSGDYSVDQAALRSVQLASPFDPLPYGFDQPSAIIEFQIKVQR